MISAYRVLTPVVGLSGGIASGKSTVSRILQENQIPLIDLDVLARVVVQKGSRTLQKLVKEFGPSILNPDQTLNRSELGRLAFANKERTRALNKITHSAIRRAMLWRLLRLWLTGAQRVVVDTPLLIEAGFDESQQLKRMLQRDEAKGLTEDDAKSRLAAQMPLSQKVSYADVVIDNCIEAKESSPPRLRAEVGKLVARWRHESRRLSFTILWLLSWLVPPFGLLYGLVVTYIRAQRQKRRLNDKQT
ncbi:dephospho-CoA kinase [Malassezia equina]|uniref:Dephospho-CoA kinase n=1 Tax=Malassezia equina TaxID=1381935 RepID=A0AAF0E830_9BASI|nr:dephospho-CoA kinase [Malassezia equina]